jgi:two-component system response regulator AtoC
MPRVLLVDDEENVRLALRTYLRKQGYDVAAAASVDEALALLERDAFDYVVTDVRMPGRSGLDLLALVRERHAGTTVVVMSAYGSVEQALEAIKAGAYDYVAKPFKPEELLFLLRKAEEREALKRENRELRAAVAREHAFDELLGKSEPMKLLFATIAKAAPFKTTVLIMGESGVGKELVARALHRRSPRSAKPFVAVNCGAIPEALLESELFGHKRGAFTDALHDKRGLFEEAEGGTLFLDEVGELPLALQVKLLRVLQEGTFRRLGETQDRKSDVRVVAATVRDLASDVKAGRFREDLYYRLNVLALTLPPLRARREDIPLLIDHFVERYNARLGTKISGLEPAAAKLLYEYSWPGNVRELENTIERAMVLADGPVLRVADLPERIREPADPVAAELAKGDLSIKRTMRVIEEVLIRRALEKTRGNRTRAAELLEISHRALLYKIKEYGIS